MLKKMKLCGVLFFLLSMFVGLDHLNGQSRFFNLSQPDGTRFQVKEMGHCWLSWLETPEGHMVQRGPGRTYHYATINPQGDFVRLSQRVGKDPANGIPVRPYENPAIRRKLAQKIDAYNKAADENRQRYLKLQHAALGAASKGGSLSKSMATAVTIEVGVILVEFNDVPHYTGGSRPNGYEVSDFETMLFSDNVYSSPSVSSPDGEDVFGSLCDYFEFQSHGILLTIGSVVNPADANGIPTWINLGNSSSYPPVFGVGPPSSLYKDAINAAINNGWNVDQDVHIIIIGGSEQDGPYSTGTGFHRGFFSSSQFPPSFDFNNWFGAAGYHERNSAEWRNQANATFTHIGIFGHELFHVLGWGIPNVFGIGSSIHNHTNDDWSLMGVGYRTGPLRKTESPGDLDAVARIMMEWAVPTDVTTNPDNETITYIEEDNNLNETFDFYRLQNSYTNDEYIIENRQYSGLNSYLPEWWKSGSHGGLLVWWHASSTSQARTIRNADNDTDVILEGMPNVSDGDRGDPFPGTTGNTAVTPYTAPSTSGGSSGTGSFTGVALTNISNSTTNMTADLWADFPPAAPQNLIVSNAGQNGQNINLAWSANSEPDLNHYTIYRGYQSGAGPIFWGGAVATTSNTNWTDTSFQINTSSSDKVHYRITAVDAANNESDFSNTVNSGTNDIPLPKKGTETPVLPKEIVLHANYPNPFNPETQIQFELPEATHVTLKVYNVLGKKVRTLVNGDFEANFHTVRWDGKNDSGKDLSSGVYIYTIQVLQQKGTRKPFTQTRKMTLLR